ncbi:MAG: Cytochrome C family protein, partial [uncultured bacterium]
MIGNNNFIKVSRRALILLVLLALSIIDADHAHAALACNVCHSMPPTDSATGDRLPATGAFKGNHQGHSSSSVDSCVPCHGAEVSAYTASHSAPPPGSGSKPVIRLTSALNNYSIGHNLAAYSRGTFFNQTTIPPNPMGTCSSVNCHFETTTPAWGTTNFVAPTDCDKCHGAPPAAIDPGSHAKHNTYYPGADNCLKCHPNNTTFQHATSAGNRPLNVTFAAAPNNGSGSYSGPLNDYLPSQTNTFGNCTATYCH